MNSSDNQITCYLCGDSNCSLLHNKIRYNLMSRPYRCNTCGFVFLSPRMNPTEEKEFYQNNYRAEYDPKKPEDLWKDSYPEAQKRVSRFTSLYTRDAHLLEIGCASGFFLDAVKNKVKTVTGIELTKEYVRYAQESGLEVKESLDEIPDNTYDLIFMFHVLEHIDDPINFLKEVKKKLSQTGKLIIEVPNVDDVLVSVYKIKDHLDFYWEIAHNYYFSRKTLEKVLESAGYRYEIFPLQRYDLSNHMRWMLTGKPGGQGYFKSIFSQSLLDEYEKCLKEKFMSDTIYAIAQKNKD